MHYDDNDGMAYYYNAQTEESVWEIPDAVVFALLEAQLAASAEAEESEGLFPGL